MIKVGGMVKHSRIVETHQPHTPVRVLYYNHSDEVSGAEISLLLSISHMRGVASILVAPQGELLNRAKQQGIPVIPVHSYRARMTHNPLVLFKGVSGTLGAGVELRRIIRQSEPDIVHANSIRAGLIALVGVVGSRTRLIWHVRDHLPTNVVGRAIRWVAARRVNTVFAISKAIQSNFATTHRLQQKTTVVHNGIDIGQTAGTSIRSELKTPSTRFVVAVVGQIARWKRQHDAITAFADFHRYFPDSELWIVGEPKFREENVIYATQLRELAETLGIAARVQFLGFRSDVMNVMTSIDALLVPSENEPFGRVVIEAMLAGKPVIGTRGGGIPEIVVDEETGYLVDTRDTAAMTARLRALCADTVVAKQIGARGRDRILQTFSIESKVQQMYAIYAEQFSKSPNRGVLA